MSVAPARRPACRGGQWKAIFFDMDGLLLDSEPLYLRAAEILFAELEAPVPEASIRSIIGLSATEGIRRLRDESGVKVSVAEIVRRYHELFDQLVRKSGVPRCPGVDRILQIVSASGIPLGVVTSTERLRAEFMLNASRLLSYFQEIVTADDVIHSKPDPEIYRVACDRLGAHPKSTIAFEDSPHGAAAACAAGCFVVAVPNALTKNGVFTCADIIVDRIDSTVVMQMLKE